MYNMVIVLGCAEITAFSDKYDEFEKLNTEVIGISTDSVVCSKVEPLKCQVVLWWLWMIIESWLSNPDFWSGICSACKGYDLLMFGPCYVQGLGVVYAY